MKRLLYTLLTISLLISGCRKDPFKVNVNRIQLDLEIERFDRMVFALGDSLEQEIMRLKDEHGHFLELFSYVINIGRPDDPTFSEYLNSFLMDEINREVYQKTDQVFKDLEWLEIKLANAFRHYLYYYPDSAVPSLYSYVSRFNHSLIIDEGIIGIGLDKYLGSEVDYYKRLGLPEYMRIRMEPAKIPSDCIYYWASTEFLLPEGESTLLDHMIHQGKLYYFSRALMPEEPLHLIFGFTTDQLEWCNTNEAAMYEYLVENKLMFSNDYMVINKLIMEAPFTGYFSQESPGRAGAWLGYQIIYSYMKRNPGITLPELMEDTDYLAIFNASKYRPE